MRPIDADAMIERLKQWDTSDAIDKALYNFTLARINEQPTIQPEPSQVAKDIARIVENGQDMRVIGQHIRGHWIPVGGALYQCDQCGAVSLERKFCSDCGADMRGER